MLVADPTIDLSEVVRRFAPDTGDGQLNPELSRLLIRFIIRAHAELFTVRPLMDGKKGHAEAMIAYQVPHWFWHHLIKAGGTGGLDSEKGIAIAIVRNDEGLTAHVASGIYFDRSEIERLFVEIEQQRSGAGPSKTKRGPQPVITERAIAAMMAKGEIWLFDPRSTLESRVAELKPEIGEISGSTINRALLQARARFQNDNLKNPET